jgi:hypothetical protein
MLTQPTNRSDVETPRADLAMHAELVLAILSILSQSLPD